MTLNVKFEWPRFLGVGNSEAERETLTQAHVSMVHYLEKKIDNDSRTANAFYQSQELSRLTPDAGSLRCSLISFSEVTGREKGAPGGIASEMKAKNIEFCVVKEGCRFIKFSLS